MERTGENVTGGNSGGAKGSEKGRGRSQPQVWISKFRVKLTSLKWILVQYNTIQYDTIQYTKSKREPRNLNGNPQIVRGHLLFQIVRGLFVFDVRDPWLLIHRPVAMSKSLWLLPGSASIYLPAIGAIVYIYIYKIYMYVDLRAVPQNIHAAEPELRGDRCDPCLS